MFLGIPGLERIHPCVFFHLLCVNGGKIKDMIKDFAGIIIQPKVYGPAGTRHIPDKNGVFFNPLPPATEKVQQFCSQD